MKTRATYTIITSDGDKLSVNSARFHEALAEKQSYHCVDRKAHTLYPLSGNADSPFMLICDDGSEQAIDGGAFAAAVESGRFYRLIENGNGTLYPYSDVETTYRIHTEDGVDEFLSKYVFQKLYERERHARYASGGCRVLLPLSDKPLVSGTSTAENNENQRRSRYNRCETPNGSECRGVCGRCPRNGEAIGFDGRENCCLKDVCAEDCSCCRRPRELKSIIPFSHFSRVDELGEDGDREFAPADPSDFAEELAEEEIRAAFVAALPGLLSERTPEEREAIIALYGLYGTPRISAREFAETHGTNHTNINRLHTKLLGRFRTALKHLQ